MRWVTWENVGVDRMACAWLIRRSIDPQAEFLFIPAGHKPPESAAPDSLTPDGVTPEGMMPFDIPGVRLSHRRGRCTFSTFLLEYNLTDPILERIARIVDEADVVQEAAVEPAAQGVDLICRGLRRSSSDDRTALERGGMVYEALYAELAASR